MKHNRRQKAKPLASSSPKSQTKEVELKFKLPDFERKDIEINIGKDSVLIRANKKIFKEEKKKDFFHSEKIERSFDYKTTVPPVNSKKAKIQFNKGILKINIPRASKIPMISV